MDTKKKAKRTTKKSTSTKETAKKSRVKGTIQRSLREKKVKREIEFSFYAPFSQEVGVGGNFNEWNPQSFRLKKNGDGQWNGAITIEPGRYEYRFLVDGNWENDQKPCELVDNGQGSYNCVVVVE